MIVVDTNVISYFYLTSEYSELAEELFAKDSAWAAPLLWRSEFRNVLAGYLRKGLLTLPDTIRITETAENLLAGNEYQVPSLRVLQLAAESSCSAYDCEFVSLAQDLGVSLITMDKKILAAFPATARSIPQHLNS